MSRPLNSSDWKRIEAALESVAEEMWLQPAEAAYRRTLDKVQSKNLTGPYTPQGVG